MPAMSEMRATVCWISGSAAGAGLYGGGAWARTTGGGACCGGGAAVSHANDGEQKGGEGPAQQRAVMTCSLVVPPL